MASVILYGLTHRIRSSRVLEYLLGHNVDLMWLAEGRNIDHTTLCKFRTRFKQPLKELFRGLGRLAMTMGLIRLGEITFDGTRVKANNGRGQFWTAAAVEKRLAELEAQFGQALDEADRTDAAEDEQFGLGSKPALPPELADAKARQQQLQEALKELKAADAARCAKGMDPTENPAQLRSTDPDSTTLPNKEGGYAPNYTPTTAVDTHRDFIVDAEVIPDAHENTETAPMVDRVEEAFGQRPETVLSDGLNATGPNIVALEQRGVEFLTPAGTPESGKGNPAVRDDPRQPVPEAAWPALPISPQTKKLDKSCFVFVPEEDVYYCPLAARFSCWRDALRLAEARAGVAAVFVARLGQGPTGVAVGVYRLQLEQTNQGGKATARGVRGIGVGCDGLKDLGVCAPRFSPPWPALATCFRPPNHFGRSPSQKR